MQKLRKNNPKHVDIIEELHTFDKNIIYLRKDCKAIRSKAQKKKELKLTRLGRTQRIRGNGLARVGYDRKSVLKFGAIVG